MSRRGHCIRANIWVEAAKARRSLLCRVHLTLPEPPLFCHTDVGLHNLTALGIRGRGRFGKHGESFECPGPCAGVPVPIQRVQNLLA